MSELSPAAQAVLDAAVEAYGINYSEFHCCADRVAAAALRAATGQAVPQGGPFLMTASEDRVRHQLLAIAAELKGQAQLTKGSDQ